MTVYWHTLTKEEVFETLQTSTNGLTEEESRKRISIYGRNEITEEKRISSILIFAKQFKELLIIILLVATTISAFIGDLVDALVIIAIVMLAIIVGFIQEYRSEQAIATLKKMISEKTRVIRDGEEKMIDVHDLVPGDIITVFVGERIPADAYIIECFDLEVNEAPLTGESAPVLKNIGSLERQTTIADRHNMLHMTTTITRGRGKAIVFATGMSTELGKIATQVQKIDLQKTPFEIRIRSISKLLSTIMLAIAVGVSILAFIRGHQILELLIWGISLAVAAVPEALPAVIAGSLTVGVYRMSKQNAIVRRLSAVETLGSTTVICSDKTGTLTQGEMTVRKIYLYDKFVEVTGVGYNFKGSVLGNAIHKSDLLLLARIAALCNDANVKNIEEKASIIGDPTEAALIVFANKAGLVKEKIDFEFPRIREIPFTSERKIMTTINRTDNNYQVFTKGSCENVLSQCSSVLVNGKFLPLDENIRTVILSANNEIASKGLRVLAFGYKQIDKEDLVENQEEKDLTFVGLAGMIDPPRLEVINAIKQCKSAGIDVVMITGDHRLTAMAVAEAIGIADKSKKIMSGTELDEINDSALAEQVENIKVYSRVSPENKIKIVRALKNKGHIVAMTGDGINDAPALKAADIGIAMGMTGTQVAKESASMILTDDNFATIVSAIKEGRRIFDNVKKYLIYLLSVNISEIIILAFSVITGWPFPLLAKHILYINLATDGTPAIALGLEPHEPDIMKRRPRDPKESVFAGARKYLIVIPILLAAVSLSLFWFVMESGGGSEAAISKARTMVFGLMVFFQLFFAFSCRSLKHNITKLNLFANKLLVLSLIGESMLVLLIMNYSPAQEIFDVVPLEPADWILMLSLATTGFICSETIKLVNRTHLRKPVTKNKVTRQ